LRALRKRKPQETQALALASSQSRLPLLRPSIPIGWRLRLLREISFTHASQAIAFEWKSGLSQQSLEPCIDLTHSKNLQVRRNYLSTHLSIKLYHVATNHVADDYVRMTSK